MNCQIKGSFILLLSVVCFVFLSGCHPLPSSEPTAPPALPVLNSTQGTSFSTIQEAIDASLPGDVIIVYSGVYYENLDFKGKNITVRSTDPSNSEVVMNTIIDGNHAGAVVSFLNGEGNKAVLEGFTIRNGSGSRASGARSGGGICCVNSSPTLSKNIILKNSADIGGGIYCFSASPRIRDNFIMLNTANNGGGGIYCGGSSSPEISQNTIANNSVIHNSNGGGILCEGSTPGIVYNEISWNSAFRGGGIYCLDSAVTVVGNTFNNNEATQQGGGIYVSRFSVVKDLKGNPWPRLNTPPNAETRNTYSGNTHQGGLYSAGADVYFEPELPTPTLR